MYRSGSSFLGSIFDKNPDVFYLFEPMTAFHANQEMVDKFQRSRISKVEICLKLI